MVRRRKDESLFDMILSLVVYFFAILIGLTLIFFLGFFLAMGVEFIAKTEIMIGPLSFPVFCGGLFVFLRFISMCFK